MTKPFGVQHPLTRFILASATLILASCSRLEPNTSEMTPEQIIQRSTHLFIGVIEKHEFPNRLLFRVSGKDTGGWKVMNMRVRVEMVLRGNESRPLVDVYEVFPTDVFVRGNWNSTQDHRRYLFPVRLENGRYRVVRDVFHSIYRVYSGRHSRLPLDDSRPFWERFALLQWWVQPDRSPAFGETFDTDPGQVFGAWRMAKVLRGLFRHRDSEVRLAACEDLLDLRLAQDECWNTLPSRDQQSLNRFSNVIPAQDRWNQNRRFETRARQRWESIFGSAELSSGRVDELRLLTTINDSHLRREFCKQFQKRFPQDTDNGCPGRPSAAGDYRHSGWRYPACR